MHLLLRDRRTDIPKTRFDVLAAASDVVESHLQFMPVDLAPWA
jgi:hypothetical protein